MIVCIARLARRLPLICVVAVIAAAAACASRTRGAVPAGTTEPDKFLFDKGTEALNNKKWLTAREFFKQVTETYTASPYPGREARHRRHVPRRGHVGSAGAGDERVPRVPFVLSDE